MKEDVSNISNAAQNRAILAVNLAKSFDNITHDDILEELEKTDCGDRIYYYYYYYSRNILKDRTLRIVLELHTLKKHTQKVLHRNRYCHPCFSKKPDNV